MAKKKKKLPMWKLLGFPTPFRVMVNGKLTDPYRIHRIWSNLRERAACPPCYKRRKDIKYYAHVTVCDEWQEFPPFYFWAILTGYSDYLSIDRKDWRKGYTPDNCRWATPSEQNKNRRMTEAWREACRRNLAKGRAAQKAKRMAAALARSGGL